MRLATAFALAAAVPLSAQSGDIARTIPQPATAFTRANVVDVRAGRVRPGLTVVVRGGRIASVDSTRPPGDVTVIDLGGRFIVPGLMDAHTHLDNLAAARRALATGVTTARSASVGSFRDVALRELVRGGYVAGPDILAAGLFVTPDLGDAVLADTALASLMDGVRGPDRLRRLVRVNLDHGVDVVKTRGTERAGRPETDPRQQVYTETELRAVVEEAARRGVPVEAHAHGDEGAHAAVRAGVRSIEHGTYLSDSTLALMRARGTYLVPTYATLIDLLEPGGDYDDPVTRARAMHMIPRMERTIRAAHRLGVRIVTGADVSYGPESITRVAHEVAHLARLGLGPIEALRAATVTAAELFDLSRRTGAIEAGLEADLLVVEANPLEDPVALQDPLFVMSNGRIAVNRLGFGRR